jgi:DNA modification methylase
MTHEYHQGNARDVLEQLIKAGVTWDYCCTSPPYFQQCDYEIAGQYGLEADLLTYFVRQTEIFSLIYEGMNPGGVCWVIIGDTLNNYSPIRAKSQRRQPGKWSHRRQFQDGYTEKELLMVPYQLAEHLRNAGWLLRKLLIWDKGQTGQPGKGDAPGECHEMILMLGKPFYKGSDRPYLHTQPLASTVLRHAPAKHLTHPCVYPESLCEELLRSTTKENATVIDPYLGSGTTARVCSTLGHRCIGIDLSLTHLDKNTSHNLLGIESLTWRSFRCQLID